ncbi:MAG: phosphatase PAP2 family protein [Cryobacterium sp.]|nr:phosphatase PAP2 family protein [Cryobacterium sp.]
MGTDIRPRIRLIRTVILSIGVIFAVIIGGWWLKSAVGYTSVEMDLLRQVNGFHTAVLNGIALGVDWLFAPTVAFLLVLIAAGVILLRTRRFALALRFMLIVLVPTVGAAVVKVLVHRPRPDIPSLQHILVLEPGGLSFPSGHTTFAACFVLGFIVLARRHRLRPALIGISVLIVLLTAASRVYLGVHYPSDVIASVVYAIAAVALADAVCLLAVSHWSERRSGVLAGSAH